MSADSSRSGTRTFAMSITSRSGAARIDVSRSIARVQAVVWYRTSDERPIRKAHHRISGTGAGRPPTAGRATPYTSPFRSSVTEKGLSSSFR